MSLRRPRRRQWSARAEILALMEYRTDLRRVREDLALLVDDHCVGVPGIPQLLHDVDKFVGHVVALVVRELPFVTEILSTTVIAAGDQVPAGAAFTHMVQGVGQAGEQERI